MLIEQKLMKSTKASDANVSRCRRDNSRTAAGLGRDWVRSNLKQWHIYIKTLIQIF